MTQHSSKRMAMNKAVKYGAIAGSIATWTISTAVAGSELELGLSIGTFYSIVAISLGLDGYGILLRIWPSYSKQVLY